MQRSTLIKPNACASDCRHWYAIQTIAGHEKQLVSVIEHLYDGEKILLYLPVKEMIHQIKGDKFIARIPLFPGYIFVYHSIDRVTAMLQKNNVNIFAKPVKADGKYLEANREEMELLFRITGENGVIKISKGIFSQNDEIRIINGPLKNLKGRILFINKRKNKAKIRIKLMNRMVDISLGLEIIQKIPSGQDLSCSK